MSYKEPDTSSYFKIKEFGNIFKDVFHIFRARGDTQEGDYDGQTVVVDPTHRSGQDPYLRVNNDKIDTKKTKHCNVGERYRLGACNYCYCNELGIRICTRHSCDNHGTELPDSEYTPKEYETECKIGVRFRLDKCNYCYCNAHRQLICTKNKCPSSYDQAPYLRSPFEEDCEEGHVLADSCVICTCTANKTYVCIPEKTEDCDMPIHTNILPQVRANDDSCIDGSQRQKDACNYCICINGIEMCTQKPCLDTVPNVSVMIEKDCVDGEVHSTYDGCNVCVCMNGKIACTNKGCLQVLRRGLKPLDLVRSLLQSLYSQSQIPPQMLEPGCNKEMLYLPEDYDPECPNVCLCDGNELFCTHRQCDKTDSKIHEPKRLESKGVKQNTHKADVTFCKPFTFFSPDGNRFCRNCFCLHNGLALCLLNLCKEDTPHKTINTKPGKMLRKYCREKDKFQMGFPPYCAQCKCLSNQWDCSVKGESCSGDVKCPFGTLIQNPRQRCSICLCGGYKPGSHNLCFTEERCVETLNKHNN
ncbi:hypothetical protein HW555_002122 [Spodoptera exigua]|uniref:Pacifastin domain-containing protein n=1 Tax=Spodoptera exigua TaxID=7107 RepID=A0A835LEM8_SPOEX|nr:hypothetical protein HW555_002122 [Spodoptera exigua]